MSEADGTLIEQVTDAILEREAYRLVAVQAIHYGHGIQLELTRVKRDLELVREEYRSFREQMMRETT